MEAVRSVIAIVRFSELGSEGGNGGMGGTWEGWNDEGRNGGEHEGKQVRRLEQKQSTRFCGCGR